MNAPWNRSIRGRLTSVIMITAATTLLLACVAMIAADAIDTRDEMSQDLTTLATIVGSNSTAALAFGDRDAAVEILSALRAKPSIVEACIYTNWNAPFATYPSNRKPNPNLTLHPDRVVTHSGRIELFHTITLDGAPIGTLYIVSDLSEFYDGLTKYVAIVGVIMLVSLLTAFFISRWLQRPISAPIVELARVANLVSHEKNYNVRASLPASRDEIGDLVDGFNDMLAEISRRDESLENEVALRTAQLSTANRELVVARDEAQMAAEVNAELSRDKQLILNSAADGIFGLDVDGRATFINHSAARMLGWDESVVGRELHEIVHGDDNATLDRPSCSLCSSGIELASRFAQFRRRDGTTFPVDFTASAIINEAGVHSGVVVTFRDITEQQAMSRMKDEFVSTVSHELRTPLTSIRGALGLLSSGLVGKIADKGQRMLEIAVTNTDRLVRLINDILDLERIDSGQIELTRAATDAFELMTEVAEGVQSFAAEGGVQIDVTEIEAVLDVDPDRITQTLTNLLGNAIKFSPRGTTVSLAGSIAGGMFSFRIADEGRGVPLDKLETIFERFQQVDASDSRDKGGSGLGLAICRSIVNAHGGSIWAEPNSPCGTVFRFTVPLRQAEASFTVSGGDGKPRVLIVEDDADLARVLTTSLQRQGIPTQHVSTGQAAIDVCRRARPALLVLDLALPDIDGFAVVDTLRREPGLLDVPVVVYSVTEVGAADRARLRLGPTSFLTKSRDALAVFESQVMLLLGMKNRGENEDAA